MIGLLGTLAGEVIFEAVKFIIMILLLVAAVFVGGKLRRKSDLKKADKKAQESVTE
ncbi:MAG: hypothetical protein Q4F11_01715 [Eubacteriales bacterium]|nr:hypothetical protein [Eubacteriales bacterium]